MAKTLLEPIQGYTTKERKKRLTQIVAATSYRMTISKLIDEAVEEMLPKLEEKYGVFKQPIHGAHSRKHHAA